MIKHEYEEHNDSIKIYTDGSKTESGVGFAATTRITVAKRRLPDCYSIYTAELYALHDTLESLYEGNNLNFTIASDSRSALQSSLHFLFTALLIMEYKSVRGGRYVWSTCNVVIASLASLSARSLPLMFMWLGTQQKDKFFLRVANLNSHAWILETMECL